jgi:hypothetical protein
MRNSRYGSGDLPPFNNRYVDLTTVSGLHHIGSLQYDLGDQFVRIWPFNSEVRFGRTSPSDAPVGFVTIPRVAIRDIASIDPIS